MSDMYTANLVNRLVKSVLTLNSLPTVLAQIISRQKQAVDSIGEMIKFLKDIAQEQSNIKSKIGDMKKTALKSLELEKYTAAMEIGFSNNQKLFGSQGKRIDQLIETVDGKFTNVLAQRLSVLYSDLKGIIKSNENMDLAQIYIANCANEFGLKLIVPENGTPFDINTMEPASPVNSSLSIEKFPLIISEVSRCGVMHENKVLVPVRVKLSQDFKPSHPHKVNLQGASNE